MFARPFNVRRLFQWSSSIRPPWNRALSTFSLLLLLFVMGSVIAAGGPFVGTAAASHRGPHRRGVAASRGPAADEPEGVDFFAEGVRLTAYFTDGAVRLVFSDGQEVVLGQAVSASGARYTDGRTLFWNKGDEALLEWQGRTYETRVATPDIDVWERARAADVDFRGVGSEPGWLVEIRSGDSMHLLLDYGTTVLITPLSEFGIHYGTNMRTYSSAPPVSPFHITVRIEERVCHDAMSGEGFTSSVTLELPDAVYEGCGRDLQQGDFGRRW